VNYWFLHQLAQVKLTGDETGGAFGIVEVTSPGGPAAPLHVHHRDSETFCVLEGELTLFVGDEVVKASAGDVVYAPAGVPHTYNVDSPLARILVIAQPAGFERFVAEVGVPAERAELPSEPVPVDPERLGALAAANGIEILGPPMPATDELAAA
jgi:quercetin dioxygenase-like cupin family protein